MSARRLVAAVVAFGAAALAAPMPVSAHGLVGRADLPIPDWLFTWGAAAVLIVSFAALAALWPAPRHRALVAFPDVKAAVRSQYWLLGVMVGFTTTALWLLAQVREG